MSAHFEVIAGEVGGRLFIDGVDVSDRVDAIRVDVGRLDPTTVTVLHRPGTAAIEGEAIIHVHEPAADTNPADAVVEFLARVDAASLEHAALMAHTAGRSLTEQMLATLADWARQGR